jgi:hypothetical protein
VFGEQVGYPAEKWAALMTARRADPGMFMALAGCEAVGWKLAR